MDGDGTLYIGTAQTYGGDTSIKSGTVVLGGREEYAEQVLAKAFCHLDASKAGTVVLKEGTATAEVRSWADVDGRWTFTQADTDNDWLFAEKKTAAINGLDTVFFTGYKNRLDVGNLLWPGFQTMVIVHTVQSGNPPKGWLCAGVVGASGSDSGIRVNGSANNVNWSPEHGQYFINGEEGIKLVCDTTYVSTIQLGSEGKKWATSQIVIGDYWGHGTNHRCYWGNVGEMAFFDTALTPGEQTAVENALMEKWGVKSAPVDPTENVLPTTTDLYVAAGATLDLNGCSQTVVSLTGYGTIINTSSTPAVIVLSEGRVSDFHGTLGEGVTVRRMRKGFAIIYR